ncbi:hypothetical protein Acr_23g0014930 [Actinidia rufa]|uniref:Copper ion binding protein n=1 Tax=Actinidia rufa TaxID=165716 RepID=A0A7J0GQS5_9ERIC|nr:hypothetical protein Acr_23g0014930 [Actinidia rufa]
MSFKLVKVQHYFVCPILYAGPKSEEKPPTTSGGPASDVKPSGPASSTAGVSTDKYRNYAVVAGVVTGLSALGWYLGSSKKKTEEVQD